MSQDTKLQQLVINKLTTAQYNAAVEAGTIDENQLYMTTDAVTVDDVKVNGTSVVTNNTANLTLGTMAQETASDYSKKSVADTLYAAKSLETTVSTHLSASNPHNITKSTIGLGNVDNTSDANKPVSTAQQTALNGKVDKINTANKIYGTDSSGVQTTYDITSFGLVDDVKVGTTSVVSNKIATLGTMAGENTSTYYTKTEVDGMVSAGMHYKGTVASYSNLPTTGQVVGDLWNVTDTGANYAWNGTTWDKMSDVNALPNSTVIPTVNNATLTITQGGVSKGAFTANASSNVTIALDSGHDIDNKSITKNSSDEIQTVGVINQNATTTAIKTWSGTLAEYNSLESHSSDCLYYITDDLQDGSVTGGADDRFTRGVSKVFPSTMYDYDNTTHTLTLKAGSKVFYPDGRNASDVLQIHEGTITLNPTVSNEVVDTKIEDNIIKYIKNI